MKILIGIAAPALSYTLIWKITPADASECGGWQCQPSKEMKAKYATRPGSKGAFCDLPIFDGKEPLEQFLTDPDRRFKPFIIRHGSTLVKEGFTKESFLKHAKQRKIFVRYGHSWTIVQSDGQAAQELPLDEFIRNYMYAKQYDGSDHMERPYVFHDDSPLLRLRETKFSIPSSIHSLQAQSKLSFTEEETSDALLIGAARSGLGFHRHSATVQMMAHGYKRWMFYPPERSPPGGDDGGWPIYDWMDKVYPSLEKDAKPIECIQKPDDLIWLPELWFHATLNLADTVAVSTQHASGETEGYVVNRKLKMIHPANPKASQHLKDIIKLQPNNSCAKSDLALTLIGQGKSTKAEGLIRKVLKSDPFHMSAIVILTAILDHNIDANKAGAEKKLQTALKVLLPTLEMNSRNYAATRLLSRYYELTRNRKKYDHYEQRLDFFDEIGLYESNVFNMTMTFLRDSQAEQDL